MVDEKALMFWRFNVLSHIRLFILSDHPVYKNFHHKALDARKPKALCFQGKTDDFGLSKSISGGGRAIQMDA